MAKVGRNEEFLLICNVKMTNATRVGQMAIKLRKKSVF
jgi:hypothetical protein